MSTYISMQAWQELNTTQDYLMYDMLKAIENKLYPMMDNILDSIAGRLRDLWDGIKDLGGDIKEAVGDVFSELSDSFDYILSGIVDYVTDAINDMASMIKSAIDTIGEALTDVGQYLMEGIASLWNSVNETISPYIESASTWMDDFWISAKEVIFSTSQAAWDYITEIGGDLYQWVSELMSDVWDYFWFVAIPALGEMLVNVIQSEEVSIILEVLGDVLGAVLDRLFTIDEHEMAKWIGKVKDQFAVLIDAVI